MLWIRIDYLFLIRLQLLKSSESGFIGAATAPQHGLILDNSIFCCRRTGTRYRAYYIFLLHTGTVSCRHRETPAVPVIVTGNVPVPVLYLSISNFINLCSTGTYISFSFVQEEASVYVYLVWLLGDYAFATVGLKCANNELFVWKFVLCTTVDTS